MPKRSTSLKPVCPRKRPSQDRSKEKVEQILTAARELLIADGLEKMTTNHVARQANMSVGSLYQYFPNKLAILYQLSIGLYDKANQDFSRLEFPKHLTTPIERFEFFVDFHISSWLSNYEEQTFIDELTLASKLYPELKELENNYRNVFLQTLMELMQRIGFKTTDKELKLLSLFLFDLSIMVEKLVFDDGYSHKGANEWGKRVAMLIAKDILKP